MYLSDRQILSAVLNGELYIKNFDSRRVQPASYDILLGQKFLLTDNSTSQVADPVRGILPKLREVNLSQDESFILHPGVSVLGQSQDYFGSNSDILIQLCGKSSLARIGLIVHNTAGLINPGHFMQITLELCNLSNIPIVLRPTMPIAQLIFAKLTSPPRTNYNSNGRYSKLNWDGYKPIEN